jgi:hypothetical protein
MMEINFGGEANILIVNSDLFVGIENAQKCVNFVEPYTDCRKYSQ